jgi:hypothetical protein
MDNQSDLINELLSSYLKVPVLMYWERASGLPFPDRFEKARVEFQGIATSWLELQRIVCEAERVQFIHGLPARLNVTNPGIEITIGQKELDGWLGRFQLPYRLELGEEALIVHTEVAGFPVAEFETSIEVDGGWFVLKPKRAAIFGVPGYVSSLFRTYLPIPPLSKESQLSRIEHASGLLRLGFTIGDFDEEISPGLLGRLQKRFFPVVDQLSGMLGTSDQNP